MNSNRLFCAETAITAVAIVLFAATYSLADPPPAKSSADESNKSSEINKELREIRVAVFGIDTQGMDIHPGVFRTPAARPRIPVDDDNSNDDRPAREYENKNAEREALSARANDPSGQGALTDQINILLSGIDKVKIVNRDQIKKVSEEHQIAMSGLADPASAVKLGKFLSAQYIIVGRASKIGQTFYLVLKIVDVETTEQKTISAKAPTESGFAAVIERIDEPLSSAIRKLQRPKIEPSDAALIELRKLAEPLSGKVLLLTVEETHVGRPLYDPAAQMAIMQRLRSLGFTVIVPKDPVAGWKESLLQTGKYGDNKVDYLLEGEGTSAFATQIQGLTSCRARVELRLVMVPGRKIASSDRGVAAGVDLVEALAAKTALEEAGVQACDALIRRFATEEHQK